MLWQKSGLSNHRSFLPIPKALTDPCICRRRSGSRGDYSSSPPPPTKPRIAYERDPAIWGFPPQRLPRSHLPSSETTLSRKLNPVTVRRNTTSIRGAGRDSRRQRLTKSPPNTSQTKPGGPTLRPPVQPGSLRPASSRAGPRRGRASPRPPHGG